MKRTVIMSCLALGLLSSVAASAQGKLSGVGSWLCFYGDAWPQKEPARYDLYILSRDNHPDIAPLKASKSLAIGYVSAGEVNSADPFFGKVKAAGLIVEKNPDWAGAYRVNMKDERWQGILLDEVIPDVIAKGFDGVFLDTMDVASYLETTKGMAGTVSAAAGFIRKIREKFPKAVIVLNNALPVADLAGDAIDALLVEDVYTLYDFKNRRYKTAAKEWTDERTAELKSFARRHGKPVLTLDYAKPADAATAKKVGARAVKDGFVPYISDIHLKTIFFHP